MESETSSVQYQLTREEVIAMLWRLMVTPGLISILAFPSLCGVVMLCLGTERPVLATGFILFPFLFLLSFRWMVHRIVTQHPELLQVQTMSFDSAGICISNSVMRVQWPWGRVRGVIESKGFYLLRFDTFGSGAAIPKRALTVEQSQEILLYAKAELSDFDVSALK